MFQQLVPKVSQYLGSHQVDHGFCVGYYDQPADDGTVNVHVGFVIGDNEVGEAEGISVTTLPETQVASLVYRGGLDQVSDIYEDLYKWIQDVAMRSNGPSRELHLEWNQKDPFQNVTEIQVPVARVSQNDSR